MDLYAPNRREGWPPSTLAVTAAQQGDLGSLTAILASGIPKLVAFYRGMGLRVHDAEDLASETCEALINSISKLRDPTRFEPWFWKVARSKFYDHLRRGRRSEKPTDRDEMYDDPSDFLVIADEHASIRVAFATLQVKDQELLWMRDVVGLGYLDIAGRMNMREGAIRVAVMRARQRLEDALRKVDQI
jgi:RNA polymerase sigma factor (sigma-70 family)